jgi:hypothetical protein
MMNHVSRRKQSALRQAVSLVVAVSLTLTALPTFARSSDPAPVLGSLSVASDPAGAAVYVDGEFAGRTPLSTVKVPAGDHRVRVVKAGYLENGRVVNVGAGSARNVDVKLTKFDGPPATAVAAAAPAAAGGEGSFFTSPLFLIAAGGGAAAAFFLLKKTNKPPTAGTVAVSPTGTGMAGATSFSFTSTGATDPDKDPLTYAWDFGDAGTGTGATATHTYAAAGTFTVKLTVSDGKLTASPANLTVTVAANLSGSWSGAVEPGFGGNMALSITQSGSSLSGSMILTAQASNAGLVGTLGGVTGSIVSTAYPTNMTLTSPTFSVNGTGAYTIVFSGVANGTTLVGTLTTTQAGAGSATGQVTFHR